MLGECMFAGSLEQIRHSSILKGKRLNTDLPASSLALEWMIWRHNPLAMNAKTRNDSRSGLWVGLSRKAVEESAEAVIARRTAGLTTRGELSRNRTTDDFVHSEDACPAHSH